MAKTSFELAYLAVCLLAVLTPCSGFPSGAPDYLCKSMKPLHLQDGQPLDTLPFTVTANPTVVRPGGAVRVTVSGDVFNGLLAVASDANQNVVSGMVRPDNSTGLKMQNCKIITQMVPDSAITHSTRLGTDFISFEWRAPADAQIGAQYTIRVTVVQATPIFWVGVPTETITIANIFVPPQVPRETMTQDHSMTSQNSGTVTSTQQVQGTTGVNTNSGFSTSQRIPLPPPLPPSHTSSAIPQRHTSTVGSQFSQMSTDFNMVDNGVGGLPSNTAVGVNTPASNGNRGRGRGLGRGNGMQSWMSMWFQ